MKMRKLCLVNADYGDVREQKQAINDLEGMLTLVYHSTLYANG